MPELPEVQSVVDTLCPTLPGRGVHRTRVIRPDVLRTPARSLARRLKGVAFSSVSRRAKNIVLRMETGDLLVVNLGMTGRLLFFGPGRTARTTHPAVRLTLTGGARLVYDDVRRFGTIELLSDVEWALKEARIGPEPLDHAFAPADLHEALQASRSPVRTFLLDQRRIAGVGNIYANEALYAAGIHPLRRAHSLSQAESAALHAGLQEALRTALASGGTTLRDYRDAEGRVGRNAPNLRAYGRRQEPCPRCGTPIERIVFGGRSAFVCTHCQPL